MVDTGAKSHIIMDIEKFKKFDNKFQPEKEYIELANGTRVSRVALKIGDAEVCLIDNKGQQPNSFNQLSTRMRQTQTQE